MKGPRELSLAQASGWLFADLLLMLVIVVLGGQSSDAGDAPPRPDCPSSSTAPSPTSSSSTAPSPTSSASCTTPPVSDSTPGLDPHSKSITVKNVDVTGVLDHQPTALARIEREVRRQTARFEGRHAALVLVWGAAAPCPSCRGIDLSRSQQLADAIAPRVRSYDPAFFPEYDPKLIRPYHDGGGTRNTVRLELFFVRT
ncbi:hypothetical protein AB0L56_28400 [Streptomyces sp. NPDC052079]|uniref:hypothetical protein n=1 Tax=Streptomyces sp. NPDC052079 TaxID=3155526 RepID=UPI003439D980